MAQTFVIGATFSLALAVLGVDELRIFAIGVAVGMAVAAIASYANEKY